MTRLLMSSFFSCFTKWEMFLMTLKQGEGARSLPVIAPFGCFRVTFLTG